MHAEESKRGKGSNEPMRTRRKPYVPDIVLTAVVVALAAGGSYFPDWAEYTGGLRGVGVGCGFLLVLGMRPLIVLVSLVVAVRWFLAKRHTPSHKLLRLTFPAICLAAILIPIRVSEPAAAAYLRGFERRMLEEVDIDAVQQWLIANGLEYAGREYFSDFPAELPGCLTEFHPWVIRFGDVASEHGITVEFRWLAPHGENFGLIVGPPTMKTPEEGMIRLPDSGFNEFRCPIKLGVYVFARG
jgi:hypothetical protein